MKKQLFAAVLVLVTMLAACSDKRKNNLEITGSIANTEQVATLYPRALNNGKITLMLYAVPFGGEKEPVQLDSITIPADQKTFSLTGSGNSAGMYNLIVQNGPMVPLVNDGSPITVDIDFAGKEKFYSIKGSAASEQLRDFIFTYTDHWDQVEVSMNKMDSLKRMGAADTVVIAATNVKNEKVNALNDFMKKFLNAASQPVVATFALGRSAQTLPQPEFEAELTRLTQKFPTDNNLADLKKRYDALKAQAAAMDKQREEAAQRAAANSWVGKKAPELVLPDATGKSISLASFKGKFVLVDFWASWCGPCRHENPNVVSAYNKFKDKNFTILGVSLDEKKEDWLAAIQKDQLSWTHVSDLSFWNSKAVSTFKFEGIPFNVLVDPQGTVIAEGLRGDDLSAKLTEVLK